MLLFAAWLLGTEIRQLEAHGHWKRAASALEARLRAEPEDAESLYLLAEAKLAFSRPQEALLLFQKASAKARRNADYHYGIAEAYGTLAEKGGFLHRIRMAKAFKREAEAVLAQDPDHRSALEDLARFHRRAPGFLGGDRSEIEKLLGRLGRVSPLKALLVRASFAAEDGRASDAEADFSKAIALEPGSYEAHHAFARYFLERGSLQRAEAEARRAKEGAPDRIGGYGVLARVFASLSRFDDLARVLEESQQEVPDDRRAYFEAAEVLVEREPARAEEYLRFYLGEPPEGDAPPLSKAHEELARCLTLEGRKDEARRESRASGEARKREERKD